MEDVLRGELPYVVAAVVRRYGDFDACEDAAQEALIAAADAWRDSGLPDNPRGWLIRVASRRLIDARRSETARVARERKIGRQERRDIDDTAPDDGAIATYVDDTLQLLMLCCHPALSPASQIALTLRAVGGLTTKQIAAAFLVPPATMTQRISRAKATLQRAGARFAATGGDEPERLAAARHVLYLIFNEGYTASAGIDLLDVELAGEAIRLTREFVVRRPDDDEAAGLLALMLLTNARAAARVDGNGDLVPLADQDRARWDRVAIAEGVAIVERTLPRGEVGGFQLQAAIAAVHAEAESGESTDWRQIAVLYAMLDAVAPGPAVTLNRAVAVGMSEGAGAGLAMLESLADDSSMARNHRLHAVRAHLLEMAGELDEARAAYEEAARLSTSVPEQRYLNRRAAVGPDSQPRMPRAET